ncbi:MAG: hypothetical protein KUG73_04475 [Pseudomonadales bacterium]|nr:hypothetical protein [Pseudomonadales bacterium]
MNIDLVGKGLVCVLSAYFVISGSLAVLDIDAKLARIGLSAINDDGKVAFILIYTSLMVGIGAAMGLMYFLFKSWKPPLVLAGTIILSFIVFRVVGSIMVGELSSTQLGFLATETIELTIISIVLLRSYSVSKSKA